MQPHKKLEGAHFGIILSDQIPFSVLLRRTLKFLAIISSEYVKGRLIWLSNYIYAPCFKNIFVFQRV